MSNDSKNALIRAAKKLFAEKGFDGTTVKDLADSAGVNISLVSYHFDGKLGLYRDCLKDYGEDRLHAAERILTSASTLDEFKTRLTLFFEEFIDAHFREPELSQIVHRECVLDIEHTRELFEKVFLRVFAKVVSYVKLAQSQGLIDPKVDPLIAVGHLIGGIVHALQTDQISKEFFKRSLVHINDRKIYLNQVMTGFFKSVSLSQDFLSPPETTAKSKLKETKLTKKTKKATPKKR
jgi:AcrR family transcriptional regulator